VRLPIAADVAALPRPVIVVIAATAAIVPAVITLRIGAAVAILGLKVVSAHVATRHLRRVGRSTARTTERIGIARRRESL
jgi:hypothetical protein